jgi:hypothetical protein
METLGRTRDEVVTLRVDFIGWAHAPVDYEEDFYVVEQDSDWITLGHGSMLRIRLRDDLEPVESAQTVLGIALSGCNLECNPRFKDCAGSWEDSVDPYAFGDVHEVSNIN